MPQNALREQLARLHDELETTDTMDGEERQLLVQLMADIHATLDRTDAADPAADGLGERVTGAVTRLEQSHPTVSFTLRRMVDLLGRMGI
ncbi:MAG: DUF4404 family protein [Pseudomonadota bacterium]